MTTSSKELAAEFNNVTGSVAEIRDDYRLPCPNNYVCEGILQVTCEDFEQLLFGEDPVDTRRDDFSGTWCPSDRYTFTELSSTRLQCPTGSYFR